MNYVIVSDLHGEALYMLQVLSMLEKRGWELHGDYLYHPSETIIVAGDTTDRGPYSVQMAHFWYGNHVNGNGSVIVLMGNHDERLFKHFYHDWNSPNYPGWNETYKGLQIYPEKAHDLAKWVYHLPYTFTGEEFNVAHAYYSKSKDLCIYGPRNREIKSGLGRINWWETEKQDKPTFAGHYHLTEPVANYETNAFIVDSWDGGIFSYGVVEDGIPEVRIANDYNSLLGTRVWDEILFRSLVE